MIYCIGISLGWNCNAAIKGVQLKIRTTKNEGYLTCPFDEMVSNVDGIIKCIEEDFCNFCNSKYLGLVTLQNKTIHMNHLKENEKLLRNSCYNFLFNHESPGHADLYINQNWAGGKNHYIDNDFYFFKNRYNRRIQNFKNYLNSGNKITFILHRYPPNDHIVELANVFSRYYPQLLFDFFYDDALYDPDIIKEHLILAGCDENSEEIKRLQKP